MNGKMALRTIAIITLTFSFVAFPGITPGIVPAHAIIPPANCQGIFNLDQCWVPSGPSADSIRIQVYTDALAEFSAASASPPQLDLTDTPIPASLLIPLQTDTRFVVTAPNPEFGMFDIDFNHANTFFGIPDNFGNNPAGVNLRQGVAHLIDKQSFITQVLGGLANPLDNPLPPSQGILHTGLPFNAQNPGGGSNPIGAYTISYTVGSGATGSYNLGGVCSWDKLHGSSCLSAFHYASDTVDSAGIVKVGQPDFCDAADHWIAAGLATGKDPTDCHLTGLSSALSTGSIVFTVRDDSPPRHVLGRALAGRMCQLINGPTVTSCSQILVNPFLPIIGLSCFPFPTSSVLLCWHMYTAGWTLTSQFDQLYSLYNSAFASSACGGKLAAFANNYVYFCNAKYDHYSSMLEFNDTTSAAVANAQVAMEIFGNHTATIPVWSGVNQFAYLKGWVNVNDARGVGPPNFFTLLNMWNPNPATACGAATGCGGSPGLIRWGFSEGVNNLNPFLASTQRELYVVNSVYDSLLAANPYSPGDLIGWMVNQFQILPPQPGDPLGTVQDIKFNLRRNLFWHDGLQVTAGDVKFSMLSYQQAGGGNAALVAGVIDVTIQNDFNFLVNLNSKSTFALPNIGSVPIVPQHLWAGDTTTKCTTKGSLSCTLNSILLSGSTADPVMNHRLIGSGGWVCKDLSTGQVGGGCTSSGTQIVSAGGTITLQRNGLGQAGLAQTAYFRASAKYKLWQWADVFNHGTVDIIDVSNAAGCLNKLATFNCTHWDTPDATISYVLTAGSTSSCQPIPLGTPNCGGGNGDGTVDFLEVTQAFGQFGLTWTAPIPYLNLIGALPMPQTLYEGGVVYSP